MAADLLERLGADQMTLDELEVLADELQQAARAAGELRYLKAARQDRVPFLDGIVLAWLREPGKLDAVVELTMQDFTSDDSLIARARTHLLEVAA